MLQQSCHITPIDLGPTNQNIPKHEKLFSSNLGSLVVFDNALQGVTYCYQDMQCHQHMRADALQRYKEQSTALQGTVSATCVMSALSNQGTFASAYRFLGAISGKEKSYKTSLFTPHSSDLTPHIAYLVPRIAHLTHLTPHSSLLKLHTLHLTSHSSYLTPHTSCLEPHTLHLAPQTSRPPT